MSDWSWNLPTTPTPGQAPPPIPPTYQPPTPASLQPVVPSDPTLWVTPETLPPPNAATDPGIIATPPGGYPPASPPGVQPAVVPPPPGFLPNGQPDPAYQWNQPPTGPLPPAVPGGRPMPAQPPTTTPPGQPPGTGQYTLPPGPRQPQGPLPQYGQPGTQQTQFNYPPILNSTILGKEGSGQFSVSPAGAIGQGQIMPATAAKYGVTPDQLFNPQINSWVRQQETQRLWNKYRDPTAVLIGYNAGDGAVDRWLASGRDPSVLPPETQRYISGTGLPGAPPPQTLIPAEAREPAGWGKPYRGGPDVGLPGVMPTERDVPQIMNTNAMALLAVASRALHAPLWATISAYGAFLKASNQRQILDQKLNQNKWQNALKESTAQQEMESEAAGEAFATYGNDPDQLDQHLAEIANQYGDPAMLAALHQGGAAAAYRLQQYRDQHNQPLQKLRYQQENQQLELQIKQAELQADQLKAQAAVATTPAQIAKLQAEAAAAQAKAEAARQQQRELQGLGVPTEGDGSGGQAPAETPPAETPPAAPDTTAGAAPPDTGTATDPAAQPPAQPPAQPAAAAPQPAAGGGPSPPPAPAPSVAPPPGARPTVPPAGQPGGQAPAQQAPAPTPKPIDATVGYLLRGGDPSNLHGLPAPALAYAQEQAAAKRAALDNVLYGSTDTGEAFVNDVRNVDAGTANQLQALLDRRSGVGQAGFGNRISEWNQVLGQMARKADPTWSPNFDKAQQQWMDPNTATARLIGRANSMVRTGGQVLEYANKISNDPNAMKRAWQQFQATGWAGSSAYTSLFQSWQSFVIESNALKTGSAGGSVTETEEQAKGIMSSPRQLGSIPPSPEQIRDAVRLDTDIAQSKLQALQVQWDHMGTRTNGVVDPMYGLVPDVPAQINAITHIDPATGRYPQGITVPPSLAATVPPVAATSADVSKALGQ